jgi:hypothetical protein
MSMLTLGGMHATAEARVGTIRHRPEGQTVITMPIRVITMPILAIKAPIPAITMRRSARSRLLGQEQGELLAA